MDQRLRGKGNYSFDEIIAYSSKKDDWIELERRLKINYSLERIIINDSKSAGWGINYRVGKNSLCYIHPEINALFIAFQIKEEVIENIKSRLSDYALKVWDNRYPCGNGGWMWYRLTETNQIDEVILLLNNKIKPKNKKRL
ncbi:MAG: DUF3788 family protein [Clostridiales bacterium]|nr:DUF3788 family protein [Clostridiales bacterium]